MEKILFAIICVFFGIGSKLSIIHGQSQQDCNIQVDAGEDLILCSKEEIQLNAVINGQYSSIKWTPNAGLSNDTILNPIVNIRIDIEYVIEVISYAENLIQNGDFETGGIEPSTTSFFWRQPSDYPNGVTGHYSVGNSTNITFVPGCDGTVGDNMMVFNGPGDDVWCQTVNVEPNAKYKLELWIGGVDIIFLANSAQVEIEINDGPLWNVKGSGYCDWNLFKTIWNSGSNTTAKICINTDGNKRSYGILDGISLSKQCINTDTVAIKFETVEAIISPSDTINCYNHPMILDGMKSSRGSGYSYEWTTKDGLIIGRQNTPTPIIDQPGTYKLKVTGPLNCTDETEIKVFGNLTPPIINTTGNDIDCKNDSVIISVSSTSNYKLRYRWLGPNGYFSNQAMNSVSNPGQYIIMVRDEYNCTSYDTITINDLRSQKDYTIDFEDIDCKNERATIALNMQDDQALINWEGPDGFIANIKKIDVFEGGTYYVTVIDSADCTFRDTIFIVDNRVYPNIIIDADKINCKKPFSDLFGRSDSVNVNFQWTGPNGFSDTNPSSTTSDTGWYYLEIQLFNGCFIIDSIYVESDLTIPSLSLADGILDCHLDEIQIMPISDNTIVKVGWIGPNGFSSDQLNISVRDSGQYTLKIEGENGCTNTQDLQIDKISDLVGSAESIINLNYNEQHQVRLTTNRKTQEIESIKWSPKANLSCNDCINPIITASGNQDYTVTIIDIYGCQITINIQLIVTISKDIFIPNTFTPNGDGINDYFRVFTIEESAIKIDMQVYDRWGNRVFHQLNLTSNTTEKGFWDGRFHGQYLPSGVYVYLVSYQLADGESGFLKGAVTLLR